ncbi:MAG: isocitrate/isopropylmalate dehydrogenase family protein [Planctomycetota bacterium]
MTTYRLVTLGGDGTGPEVMAEAVKCLDVIQKKLGLTFERRDVPCGGAYFLKDGKRDWPEGSEKACQESDLILLGAVGWPSPTGKGPVTMPDGRMAGHSPVIGNRANLNLFANVRPVKLYPGVTHRIHGSHKQVWEPGKVDMVFVRENTEDLYVQAGGGLDRGGKRLVVTDTRIITREGTDQVVRYAFELCKRRNKGAPGDGKKRVTCIVKDNVLEGCRFFKRRFLEIGEEYPDIEKDPVIVDAFTQWLVTSPENFDVLVAPNMFGDIVTDLASVLQGGMGMAAGANIGPQHGMFEPIHGSAPKHAGLDKVNPLAMIMALREGLIWLGERKQDPKLQKAAGAIEASVIELLKMGSPLTYDLAPSGKGAKCSEVGSKMAQLIGERL